MTVLRDKPYARRVRALPRHGESAEAAPHDCWTGERTTAAHWSALVRRFVESGAAQWRVYHDPAQSHYYIGDALRRAARAHAGVTVTVRGGGVYLTQRVTVGQRVALGECRRMIDSILIDYAATTDDTPRTVTTPDGWTARGMYRYAQYRRTALDLCEISVSRAPDGMILSKS